MTESALIICVPEAEPYIGHLRDRFDPAARLGIPAHITLLYPFMSPEYITEEVLEQARRCLLSIPRFSFRLAEVRHFPGTLYLAPEPVNPFIRLTEALMEEFPEYPPYGGIFDSIVPHLTVAHTDAEGEKDALEAELVAGLPKPDGIVAICSEIVLFESSSDGMWREMHFVGLGPAEQTNRSAGKSSLG